jgi:hypothetical protein
MLDGPKYRSVRSGKVYVPYTEFIAGEGHQWRARSDHDTEPNFMENLITAWAFDKISRLAERLLTGNLSWLLS